MKKATKKKAASAKKTTKKTTAAKKTVTKKAKAKTASPKKAATKKAATVSPSKSGTPSQMIDGRIEELGDWRGETLAEVRALVKKAIPDVVEEWKWRGVPVWYSNGIVCTGESYKAVVKMTFQNGAALKDPAKLFNSSLEGNQRRAIDIHENEKINAKALVELLKQAAVFNALKKKK